MSETALHSALALERQGITVNLVGTWTNSGARGAATILIDNDIFVT